MKYTEYKYEPGTTLKIPVTNILYGGLITLKHAIEFIKSNKPQLLEEYIDILKTELSKSDQFDVSVMYEPEIMKIYPDLHKLYVNKILTLLNYSKYDSYMIEDAIEIEIDDAIRSMHLNGYYLSLPFLELLDDTNAIELSKQFGKYLVQTNPASTRESDTIDDRLNGFLIAFFNRWKAHDVMIGKYDENTILYKITKCRWHDIMKEMNLEPSLFYASFCYGDYAMTKRFNPNFELTRTKTLVEGFQYCDFCERDTRYSKDSEHPQKEFWEQLS